MLGVYAYIEPQDILFNQGNWRSVDDQPVGGSAQIPYVPQPFSPAYLACPTDALHARLCG